MGGSHVPDYSAPKQPESFVKPLDEADRFSGFEGILDAERKQSGNLPDQPAGLEVDASPGNAKPYTAR